MTNEVTKKERHHLLKKIIAESEVHDQIQLLEALRRFGVETTQATISRDLQEIGVVKVRVRSGVFKYSILEKLPQNYLMEQLKVLFDNFVYAMSSTGNLLLIKTSPGNANGVASLIDRINFPGVLGTIAGDDTILVVVGGVEERAALQDTLDHLLADTPDAKS